MPDGRAPNNAATNSSATNNAADFDGRRARFRQYESPAAIDAYLQRLAREWPERAEVADHIAQQNAALKVATPTVLELCCGPGRLAQTLFQHLPTLRYTGVDISPPFLAYAQQHLTAHAAQVTLRELDLSDPTWSRVVVNAAADPAGAAQFHAIVSMQSLHDVGDEAVLARIYQQAETLLLPGGFLLNADLVVAVGEDLPNNPGRRSIPRHLALLAREGYDTPRCTLARGNFGAVVGWKR